MGRRQRCGRGAAWLPGPGEAVARAAGAPQPRLQRRLRPLGHEARQVQKMAAALLRPERARQSWWLQNLHGRCCHLDLHMHFTNPSFVWAF